MEGADRPGRSPVLPDGRRLSLVTGGAPGSAAEVDAFVAGLPRAWQRETCRGLLEVTRRRVPPLSESLKWGQPHFDGRGAVMKWYCAVRWTNVLFYRGDLLDDRDGLFEATDNVRQRIWRLGPEEPLHLPAFARLLDQAVELDARRS